MTDGLPIKKQDKNLKDFGSTSHAQLLSSTAMAIFAPDEPPPELERGPEKSARIGTPDWGH